MERKGFTLIELLAVIAILAAIMAITTVSLTSILFNSEESLSETQRTKIEQAAEVYYLKEGMNNNSECVDLSYLISKGYIESKAVVDPQGREVMNGSVKITYEANQYTYKYQDTECSASPNIYVDETGAMIDLPTGLTPVIYSDNNWKVADISTKWYDYNTQEWANAVILNAGVTKNVGDTIDVSSEIKGMFVYVPRYEYKIEGTYGKGGTTAATPGEIEVNFISKDKTTASSGYILHPAFNFGGTELNGLWVGKFETTGTEDVPTVLPSVTSLRNQFASTQFTTAQKFATYINNSNIDAHMSKNSEWGAVAYLSQSKYGKYGNASYIGTNKQIMINNCSNYITGVGADSQNDSSSTTTCTTNTYETEKGQAASTTGNITGVYDMSGGAIEAVMGVYNKTAGSSYFTTLPDEKYYDNYTSEIATTACNGGICYGHALSETSGWYNDYSQFVSSSSTWFRRGGYYGNASNVGIFNFQNTNGATNKATSFRVVITGILGEA